MGKISKETQKIKGCSITCSHIRYFDIPKCENWSAIHSVKVWWRYVLPNTNADHFCDSFSVLGQCFRPAKKIVLEIKNPDILE